MFSSRLGIYLRAMLALIVVATLPLLAQTGSKPKTVSEKTAPQEGAATTASPEADDDPDMPGALGSRIDEATFLQSRAEYFARIRGIDPKNPPDLRIRMNAIRALQQREQQLYGNRAQTAAPGAAGSVAPFSPPSSTTWTELGPSPIPNGQTSPSVAVSGRVTAIAVHPTNPNIIYVGAAQGGVFRSLDGGSTWTPLMDSAQSLAIGAITIDPITPSTVFVGTGEGNLSLDSFFGVGIYRIDNADTSPVVSGPFDTQISGSGTGVGNGHAFVGTSITKIVVDPANDNRIFVVNTLGSSGLNGSNFCCGGTNPPSGFIGVHFSSNALAATPQFSFVFNSPGGGVGGVTDIVFEPGTSTNMLIAVEDFGGGAANSGVWRTTNATNAPATSPTFTRTLNLSGQQANIKLAINKVSTTVTVLAGTQESNGTLHESTDAGVTWPTTIAAAAGFCGGQCFYDLVVTLKPDDANTFFLGGAAGSLMLKKTINGGSSFTTPNASLHADTHAIVYAPSDFTVMYEGNDGGLWRSADGGGTWTSINTAGFKATQFQSLALHPSDREFMIGGTQDNGTEFRKPDTTWTRADFGDGGYSLIDQNAADTTNVTMYHTYFNQSNNQIGYAHVSSTTNASDGLWSFSGCSGNVSANGIACGDSVLFYAPLARGPGSPNTVYMGTDRLYRSANGGTNNVVVSQAPIVSSVPITTIGISPQNDNVRIVGLKNGKVFATTTGSSTLTDVTGTIPAHYIGRAIIDPNNVNTAYVTLDDYGLTAGQHVWKTTNLNNATPTWTASGSGIPDVPTNSIVIDPANSNSLFVGTDIGVYHSADGGATWNPWGTGLPRVAVFDIAIQSTNHVLRAATHGRGLWEIASVSVVPPTITKSFNTASIPLNGTTALNLTVSNPNLSSSLSGIGFTDTLPAGLVVSTPNGLTGSCGGGTITAVAGSGSVSLSGATLAANTSCTFSVNVTGTTAGTKSNTTGVITATESGAGTTSNTANLTVVAPPSIAKAFNPLSIPVSTTSSLQFTITNPGANTVALTGVAFTDTLPSGLTVASSTSTVCGGTLTTTNPTGISLSGATINTSGQCQFSVTVTGATAGQYTNTTGSVTSTNGGTGNTASANLSVVTPPSIVKSFNPTSIALNANSTLSFTITNPNTFSSMSGVAFTDSLPAGIVVATPNGISGSCGSGTLTATAGSSSISLSGGTLTASPAAGSSCTFSANVTGTTAGVKSNSVQVTSTEGGTGNTANASITVITPPTISKSFNPTSIALNANSTLSFTITNPNTTSALNGVAFTDSLPAGVIVATPNGISGSCGSGTITATAGSSSISLSSGTLTASPAAGSSCTFSVNVTGTTGGSKSNTTGAVTSTEGGTGAISNTATLTVVAPPSIAKTFNPNSIFVSATTSLQFTITNPAANTVALTGVAFTDTLPTGLTVASSTSTVCGGTLTTTAPTGISLSGATISTSSQCQFSVTVTGATAGPYTNTTGNVTSTNGGTGNTASANLTVLAAPSVAKAFNPTAIPLNGTTTLTITITNPAINTVALTTVTLVDSLPAGLTVPGNVVGNPCSGGGTGGSLNTTTTTTISLGGVTIPANSQCIITLTVTGTAAGQFTNTTGSVSSGNGGTGNTASANLTVVGPPTINKSFNPTSIALNTNSTLSFTITNSNTSSTLSGVAFTDSLPAGLVVATPNGVTGSCGSGTITAIAGSGSISLSGGTLTASPAAGSTCTFSVNVTGTTAGSKSNTTGAITSTEGGTGSTSNTATLTVVAPPSIAKAFNPTTIPVNTTSSLQFTITNPGANTVALTGVAFTDTLPTGLTVASSTSTVCGGTLTTTAPTGISLSGATISTGGQCQFSVTVTGATVGQYTNTTGNVSSTNGGTGNTASAGLTVLAPPTINKSFGAPRIAIGGTAALSFTIHNPNTSNALTGVAFSDTLPAGLVINNPNGLSGSCGGGTITATAGASVISLSGATLAASATCTFSVTVLGTAGGDQNNTTGNVTSNEGGTGLTASATINVIAPPTLSLAFNPTSIALGGTTSLQFTITNPAVNTTDLNGVAFTDTLPTGLTVSSSSSTVCGGTLTTSNPTTIHLSGATVSTASPCSFSVTVTGAVAGNYSNLVSGAGAITSTTGGIGATGPASNTANLTVVAPPVITKSFGASTVPKSGTVSLTFTINNPNTTAALSSIAFTDNLPSGLFDGNPPNLNNTCGGTATATAGSTVISLSGGTLPANTSCSVTLNILGVSAGLKTNSVQVTSNEGGTGNTSSDSVTVVYPPALMKGFGAASIPLGGTTSLTFSLSTINATVTLTGIAFTDPLPAGLIVSTPNGLTSNCGGTVTAIAGSGSISLSSGTLAPSTSCNIIVNVTGTAVGVQNNTTSTVSSNEGGTGGSASASVNVDGPPTVSKAFNPTSIALNGTSALTFTLTNPGANPDTLTGMAFTDSLQSGLVVATPNGLTGSCLTATGAVTNPGSVTAVAGSTSISLSALALTSGGTCTFTVNVTGTQVGTVSNTTGAVTSTNGGTGATSNTATLTVGGADIGVTLIHHPDPAAVGGRLFFVATVTNNGPSSANVTLTQTFTGAQYVVSANVTQGTGSCSGTGPITCTLSGMANAEVRQVTIVVTPLLGRNVTGTATVATSVTDPNSSNNTASSTARIRIKPQRF